MKAYRCSQSGLLLPPDYKKNWGIYYGHGLGPEPVSECLNSNMRANIDLRRAQYNVPPEEYMFPFHITRASVSLVDVSEEEYANPDNRMILAIDDRDFKKRSAILRSKQKEKAEWVKVEIAKKGAQSKREVWR